MATPTTITKTIIISFIIVGMFYVYNVNGAYFGLNDHFYERISGAVNITIAERYCNLRTSPNNTKGYLATITSYDEWLFLASSGVITSTSFNSWFSGTVGSDGIWRYNTGPENGEAFYDQYSDRNYRFHRFPSHEPNVFGDETFLELSRDDYNGFFYNNLACNAAIQNSRPYICEFGGLETPYVSPVATSGGLVTIKFPAGSNYNFADFTVTFVNIDTPSITFNCTNITVVTTNTLATCIVPPNQGRYKVTIKSTAPTLVQSTMYWSYLSPYASFVKPAFKSGGVVTIVGGSFGNDASKISIYSGNPRTRVCSSIQFIQTYLPDTVLTCVLSSDVPVSDSWDKFLPLFFNVSGVITIQNKVPLFDDTNKQYYYGWRPQATITEAKDVYPTKIVVDGYTGRMSYIETGALFQFVNTTLSPISPQAAPSISLWQGIKWSGVTASPPLYTILQGPRANTNINIYAATGYVPTLTTSTPFALQLTNDTLFSPNSASWYTDRQGVFNEYGGISPYYLSTSTFTLSTNGGVVKLKLNLYGALFSNVTISLRGSSITSFNRTSVRGEIDVLVPAGSGGSYPISVNIDGMSTPTNTQFIQYMAPNITGISPPPFTNGSFITVTGTNFYYDPSKVSLVVGGFLCTNVSFIQPHTSFTCLTGIGSGMVDVFIEIDGLPGPKTSLQFQSPIIQEVSSSSPLGGNVTITGYNFFNNISLATVSLNSSLACSGIDIIVPHNKIVCSLPPQQGRYYLTVYVSFFPSLPFPFAYDSPTISSVIQVSDYIVAYGNNFGNDLAYLGVFLGSVSLKQFCLGNNTYIICNPVPWNAVSSNFIINGSAVDPSPVPFYFTPVLTSISENLFTTAGGAVVLQGRYFEPTAFGVTNNLVVIDNGAINSNPGYQSLTTLNYQILPGTGINREILVQSGGNRNSSSQLFSFFPPTVVSYVMDPSTDMVTVNGTNFGINPSKIIFQMGGLKARNVAIQSPHTTVSFTIQNQSLSGDLSVNVDEQPFTYSNLYLTPQITNSTLPSVDGGNFYIYGKYLSPIDQSGNSEGTNFTIGVQPLSCQYVSSQNGLYTYLCNIGGGSGHFTTIVSTSSGKTSSPYQMSYQPPTITSVSSITFKVPGTITLYGTNYASEGLSISLTNSTHSTQCTSPQVFNSTMITCHYDASLQSSIPLSVKVVVNGLEGIKGDGFVYTNVQVSSINQINDYVVIQGLNFGNVANLQIFIGDVPIPSCTGKDTMITCNPLPVATKSGTLFIDNGLIKVSSQNITFTPFLVSLSDTILETIGQNITINGRFFEQVSMDGNNNTIYIINNGEPPVQGPTIQVLDSQRLVYLVPPSTGTLKSIAIQVDSRLSNSLLYSFEAPNLVGSSQQQYVLYIYGKSFGQLTEDLQIQFGVSNLIPTSVNDSTLQLALPPSSLNANLSISVSGQPSNQLFVSLVPILFDATPLPKTIGSNITVTGDFLSPNDIAFKPIDIQFSSTLLGSGVDDILTCTYLSKVIPYSITCVMDAGYGYYDLVSYYNGTYSDPLHTSYLPPVVVTSTSLFFNKPGFITVSGESFAAKDLQVSIGYGNSTTSCSNITLIDDQTIECYYTSDIESQTHAPLNITVECGGLIGQNDVFLYYETYQCPGTPSPCSGRGLCHEANGFCQCDQGYAGWDCSIEINANTPTSQPPHTNSTNGSGNFPTGYSPLVEYNVRVAFIREISSSSSGDVPVYTLSVNNITWLQPIVISINTTLFSGYWNDSVVGNTYLLFNVTQVSQLKNITFAGANIPVDANSIKYTVKVENWTFTDPLNRLEILFATSTSASSLYNCTETKTTFDNNALDQNNNYFTNLVINSGPAILNVRFADRIILDDGIIRSKTLVLSSGDPLYQQYNQEHQYNNDIYTVLAGVVTPSFSNNVIVDPSFGTISRPNYNLTCHIPGSSDNPDNDLIDNEEPRWKLPVIIVGSVVGALLVAGVLALIIKNTAFKKDDSIKLKGWNANKAYSGPNGGGAAPFNNN